MEQAYLYLMEEMLLFVCRCPLEVGKWRTTRNCWFLVPAKAMRMSNILIGMTYSSCTVCLFLTFLAGHSGCSSPRKGPGRVPPFLARQRGHCFSSPHLPGRLSRHLRLLLLLLLLNRLLWFPGRWNRGLM